MFNAPDISSTNPKDWKPLKKDPIIILKSINDSNLSKLVEDFKKVTQNKIKKIKKGQNKNG
jgi:hypothetical protein